MATATDGRVGFHSNVQGLSVRQCLRLLSDCHGLPKLGVQEVFVLRRAFLAAGLSRLCPIAAVHL